MLKLNYFELELTDDEGWRIEIPGLPELTTEIGAKEVILRMKDINLFLHMVLEQMEQKMGMDFFQKMISRIF